MDGRSPEIKVRMGSSCNRAGVLIEVSVGEVNVTILE
jgi:hypothetical protein